MNRNQLPDTPEGSRRAKRVPIVVALFAVALMVAAPLLYPGFRAVLGGNLSHAAQYTEPSAARLVPDQIPMGLPAISRDAIDVRGCVRNPECDPAYYEPGVR